MYNQKPDKKELEMKLLPPVNSKTLMGRDHILFMALAYRALHLIFAVLNDT